MSPISHTLCKILLWKSSLLLALSQQILTHRVSVGRPGMQWVWSNLFHRSYKKGKQGRTKYCHFNVLLDVHYLSIVWVFFLMVCKLVLKLSHYRFNYVLWKLRKLSTQKKHEQIQRNKGVTETRQHRFWFNFLSFSVSIWLKRGRIGFIIFLALRDWHFYISIIAMY